MPDLETTRLSLHAVAELVLAGPQYDESRTIKLRVTPGGFGTVAAPDVRVDGTSLVVDGRPVPLHGHTVAELAACAAEIAEAFRRGDEALAALDADAQRVLWPEHFDVAISLDEVNYGVSPGDDTIPEPYAYVGPWSPADFTGPFWNASFGAARPVREVEDLAAFFAEGRALTSGG